MRNATRYSEPSYYITYGSDIMWKIYKHTFPNGKVYIGQTNQPLQKRFKNGEGYTLCPLIHRAILKYGWDSVKTEILYDNIQTQEEANELEILTIQEYNSTDPDYGYNLAAGGGAVLKCDENLVLKKWNEGFSVNEIANLLNWNRNTISRALTRLNISEEERKQRSQERHSLFCRKFDYEAIFNDWKEGLSCKELQEKYNCSDSVIKNVLDINHIPKNERYSQGRKRLRVNQISVNQYDLNGNFLRSFNSIAEANLSLNKSQNSSNIVAVCKGRRKTAYGYIWKYN